jgi:hypothetical protein
MTSPCPPDGVSPSSASPTTIATPSSLSGYRPAQLAMVYPSCNPERPISVGLQVDGQLMTVQVTLRHAAGLAAMLTHLVAQQIERQRT